MGKKKKQSGPRWCIQKQQGVWCLEGCGWGQDQQAGRAWQERLEFDFKKTVNVCEHESDENDKVPILEWEQKDD